MLLVTQPLMEVAMLLTRMVPTVLSSSKRKIEFVMKMFEESVEESFLTTLVNRKVDVVMTPKLFQYRIFTKARSKLRTMVLPEGDDKRVVAAAAELAERGLCTVVLLGVESDVLALATQQKVKLTGIQVGPRSLDRCGLHWCSDGAGLGNGGKWCRRVYPLDRHHKRLLGRPIRVELLTAPAAVAQQVIDPKTSGLTAKYASLLFDARKAKGMTEDKALSLVTEVSEQFYTWSAVSEASQTQWTYTFPSSHGYVRGRG